MQWTLYLYTALLYINYVPQAKTLLRTIYSCLWNKHHSHAHAKCWHGSDGTTMCPNLEMACLMMSAEGP